MTRTASSLQTEFAGLTLKNPFLLASGPPTRDAGMLDRAFAAGWAGAVVKTIPSEGLMQRGLTEEPRPLLAPYVVEKRRIGMGNLSITGEWRIEEWAEALPELKEQYSDRVVLGSLGAELIQDDWQTMAGQIAAAGFDGIELDLSCTHAKLGRHTPLIVGEDPELVARVVGWVTDVVDIPVIPKFPATVRDWQGVLQACREAGAAGVTSINTLSALMGVDLESMEPQPSLRGRSTYCGYSGPGIKPIALRVVSQIDKVGLLPVSGVGGIGTWQDAAEFVLLGARCVQVCTAVMWSGYKIVKTMIAGLVNYLEQKGVSSLDKLIGEANKRVIDSVFDMEPDHSLVASVTEKCTNCGRCVTSCWDGGHQAIITPGDKHPIVNEDVCAGCGLCVQVCPVGAIKLGPRWSPDGP